jgi:hypothetical protein
MSVPITACYRLRLSQRFGLHFLGQFRKLRRHPDFASLCAVHVQYIHRSRADDNRSLAQLEIPSRHKGLIGMYVLRKSFYQFLDLFHGVVKMRRDAQPVTAWCGDDVSFLELRVKFH